MERVRPNYLRHHEFQSTIDRGKDYGYPISEYFLKIDPELLPWSQQDVFH